MKEKVILPNGWGVETESEKEEKNPIEEMGVTTLPNGWKVTVIR